MQVLSGLFDGMILQRNGRGVSDGAVEGACCGGGGVQVRVRCGGRAVRGFNWVRVGSAVDGKFAVRVKGVAVGGPYDIDLRIVDRKKQTVGEVSVSDVLVGDVWILAGQSNMGGCGILAKHPRADRFVRTFQMNHRWETAQHPIHRLDISVDQVHTYIAGGVPWERPGANCVGPGLAFGQMMRRRTGVPQGLIPCAHGGSSMQQWDPGLKKFAGRSLYGASVRRAKLNGGRVAGILWYQGCNDAGPCEAEHYTARMQKMVRAFRRDLGDARLPFVAAQLARNAPGEVITRSAWDDIQEQQRLLPDAIDRMVIVPTVDLGLEDTVHLDGASQERLGRRFAQATLALTQRPREETLPIELGAIKIKRNGRLEYAIIEMTFKNVVGGFVSSGRAMGFSLSIDGRLASPAIHKTEFLGNKILVYTTLGCSEVGDYRLSYGLGPDPYCNITDEGDRSLPVFGPLGLQSCRAITPFIGRWRISDLLADGGKLGKLARPDVCDDSLGWQRREFLTRFVDLHDEFECIAPQDGYILCACRFDCSEKMALAFWFGYDGPVKMWIDRKMVFQDPNGTPPAVIDAERIDFTAGKGGHEIVVALGADCGAAWGVYLRIERMGISKRLLLEGAKAYAMPEIPG